MLFLGLVVIVFGRVIFADNDSIGNSSEPSFLENLSIFSYRDGNNVIRVNISWDNVTCDCDDVSIWFNDQGDGCPAIRVDNDHFNIRDHHSLVVPKSVVKHPNEKISPGCSYEILFDTGIETQKIIYKTPNCIGNSENSPYRLDDISLKQEDIYMIHWEKLEQINLNVSKIVCQELPEGEEVNMIIYDEVGENGLLVSCPNLEAEALFSVTVTFRDYLDGCDYYSSIIKTEPGNWNMLYLLLAIFVPLVITFGILLLIIILFPKIWEKLNQYLECKELNDPRLSYLETPLTINFNEMKVNQQYTPLEFILVSIREEFVKISQFIFASILSQNVHKFDEYEFPRNKIVLETKLDGGAFGTVFSGKAFEIRGASHYTMVAVKQIKDDACEEKLHEFLNEIETMKKIGQHENIVRLLGCVTMDQPYMLIMELVPCGSLKKYLCKLRDQWTRMKQERFIFPDNHVVQSPPQALTYTSVIFETGESDSYIIPDDICLDAKVIKGLGNGRNRYISENSPISLTSSDCTSSVKTYLTALETPSPKSNEMNDSLHPLLDHNELQNFAFQIAKGMKYLESIQVTHRDLAARNVLISVDKTLKISDFGLSRTGIYVNSAGARLPLRWMAMEAIEARTCDPKTDVWSFGIVLWEIGTLGAMPYNKMDDCQILPYLRAGKRLERPGICTDDFYSLMLRCWRENPDERPSFVELVELLETKKNVYVDFREVSPKYVFPPTGAKIGNEEL